MAEKKKERETDKAESSAGEPAAAAPAAAGGQEIELNEERVQAASYANFARVTGTPEEVILDLALNPNPFAAGKQKVNVSQRLIMNYFTAKRLLAALSVTVQRHESAFGAVELDVRRRAARAQGK